MLASIMPFHCHVTILVKGFVFYLIFTRDTVSENSGEKSQYMLELLRIFKMCYAAYSNL